jgi:ABC-type proline/glycine betaine transport system permease subunit
MKKNQTHHADATIKGVALGALTYAGTQFNLPAEVIAAAVPVVALALSWLSTKIGDKNTTLLLKLAVDAIAKAPAKKKK